MNDHLIGKHVYYKMDDLGKEHYESDVWEGFTKVNGVGDITKGPYTIIIDKHSDQANSRFVHIHENEILYVFEGKLIELISE